MAISLLTVVDTDPYLLTLTRYIELNPERGLGGLPPGDYPWSSYATMPYDDSPQRLYWTTIQALLPLAFAWLGLARLWWRWRQRTADPGNGIEGGQCDFKQ